MDKLKMFVADVWGFIRSIFDGRVYLPWVAGSLIFLACQDLGTIGAMWSGLGVLFVLMGFATLVRRVLCPHVDLSEVYKKAIEDSKSAAVVYASQIFLMAIAIIVALTWIN